MNLTTHQIEVYVAEFFNIRQHMIVPNISWGLGIHECDLLIVTKAGFANEVEIKVNKYDLKKDQKKWHGHRSNLIRRLFFAIPQTLLEFKDFIPERAGIIEVSKYFPNCRLLRPAKINKNARKLSQDQINHIGRLASMRIWSLRQALINNHQDPADYLYDELRQTA